MNPGIFSLLKKASLFSGLLFLGWTAQAQSSGNNNNNGMSSDTTHHRGFRKGPGGQDRFRSGDAPGQRNWASREQRAGFRSRDGRGGHEGFRGHEGRSIRYTPEQRKQLMAINKEYHQKAEDLFKNDNITLREYKAGLVGLQNDKKIKTSALLTPQQKEEMAAREKRRTEDAQVMAAAQMERLKLRLNLSDDQVAKIKAGQQNLHSQAKAIRDNASLLPQQKREQMKDLMAKHKDVVKSVLTPEQQTQFEKMSHRRGGPGGPGGPGGRGRMGRFGSGHGPDSSDDNQAK